ncbi:MAG: hypothetical protein COA94_07180 [Rickettsiales bacterium]|nr:MAG: hypothetical protein COA94_07180 [Rickettsiales bacterium]
MNFYFYVDGFVTVNVNMSELILLNSLLDDDEFNDPTALASALRIIRGKINVFLPLIFDYHEW